jgi:hypothetical protein
MDLRRNIKWSIYLQILLVIVCLASINLQKKILKNPVVKSTFCLSRCLLICDLCKLWQLISQMLLHYYNKLPIKSPCVPYKGYFRNTSYTLPLSVPYKGYFRNTSYSLPLSVPYKGYFRNTSYSLPLSVPYKVYFRNTSYSLPLSVPYKGYFRNTSYTLPLSVPYKGYFRNTSYSLPLSVPYKGYFRNTSYSLPLISNLLHCLQILNTNNKYT